MSIIIGADNSTTAGVSSLPVKSDSVVQAKTELYNKYLAVIRNLGNLAENQKPCTDLKEKTLVADERLGQWVPIVAMCQRYLSGFNAELVTEALQHLNKIRKKGFGPKPQYRSLAEEISDEYKKIGISSQVDYRKLRQCDTAESIDLLFESAGLKDISNPGLKYTLKYYIKESQGKEMLQAVSRTIKKLIKYSETPSIPTPPTAHNLHSALATRSLRRATIADPKEASQPQSIDDKSKRRILAGSKKLPGNASEILQARNSLRGRNSAPIEIPLPGAANVLKTAAQQETLVVGSAEKKSRRETQSEAGTDLKSEAKEANIERDVELEKQLKLLQASQLSSREVLISQLKESPMVPSARHHAKGDSLDASWIPLENKTDLTISYVVEEKPAVTQSAYVVKKVGNASLFYDRREIDETMKGPLKDKLERIHASNINSDDE